MKIAYDCRLLQRPHINDGASRYAFELLKSIMTVEPSLELYFLGYRDLDNTQLSKLLQIAGKLIPTFRRNRSTEVNYLLTQIYFPRILRKYGIDLFHALFQTDALLFTKTPEVITVHDLGPYFSYTKEERKKIETAMGNRIRFSWSTAWRFSYLCKAQSIIADSEFTKNRLLARKLVEKEKIKVIYCGSKQPISPDKELLSGFLSSEMLNQSYVLMVGRIQPFKNILGAIEAFQIFLKKYSFEANLLIVGMANSQSEKDYLQRCKDLATNLGIGKKVMFLGYVSDNLLTCLYSRASVFLQSSFLEGFGLPPLESAMFGVPVVISDAGSLSEILPQAVLSSPYSPAMIAQGLYNALRSDRPKLMKWNTWEQTARNVIDVYHSVAEWK